MNRLFFPMLLLSFALICSAGEPNRRILWVAHRGEPQLAPENTVESFRLAMESGSDGSECDAWLSKDGKVVISHDESTGRMGDRKLIIPEHTAELLREVNVAGRFRGKSRSAKMPFLEELFPLIGPGRFLSIELKSNDPRLIPAIRELVSISGLKPEQIEFCCFSQKLCLQAKTAFPEHRVMWNTSAKSGETVEQILQILRECRADGVNIFWNSPLMTAETVRKLHENGYFVLAWTVDNLNDARKVIDMGVDAITSNRAGKLKKEYEREQSASLKTIRLNPAEVPVKERVSLLPGQVLELALKSNPTTGYDWEVFLPETEVLTRSTREYRPDSNDENLCGAGGTTILRFEAKKPGRINLIGCYCRSWEKLDLKDAQTFTLSVEVPAPQK